MLDYTKQVPEVKSVPDFSRGRHDLGEHVDFE
jgi:hypothetical protein